MRRMAGVLILFVTTAALANEQKDIPVLRDANVDDQTVHAFDVIGINFVEQKLCGKYAYGHAKSSGNPRNPGVMHKSPASFCTLFIGSLLHRGSLSVNLIDFVPPIL